MKNKNYLKIMTDDGYSARNVDDFHKIAIPYLGEKFFPNKNSHILDIGAGSGMSIFPLKNVGYKNLQAIDIDDYNKELFESNGIKFSKINAETEKLPFEDNTFDAILSFYVIAHLSDPANYLNEIYRVLKKYGVFILVTPDWRQQYKIFWRDYTHIHPYDKVSIEKLLRAHNFENNIIKNFGVFRGIGKTGLWKLFKSLIFTGISIITISKK
jgi:ubiquinone/menaquinone biosynthesis C-methylase UbiE